MVILPVGSTSAREVWLHGLKFIESAEHINAVIQDISQALGIAATDRNEKRLLQKPDIFLAALAGRLGAVCAERFLNNIKHTTPIAKQETGQD